MRALLLAAGIGSRLRPLTESIPKCLVPIHGRPLLAYWLQVLFQAGIERTLINTHHLPDKVLDFLAHSPWRHRVDVVHEERLLGTGGTLIANESYFMRKPLLLAHADNLTDFDLHHFAAAHRNRPPGCIMTMLAFRTDNPTSCGILDVDKNGILRALHEKIEDPPGNLANAAIYLVEPGVLDYGRSLGKAVLNFQTEIIPAFLDRVFVVKHRGYHRDIGTHQSLELAHREFTVVN